MEYDMMLLRSSPAGRFLDDEELKAGTLESNLRQAAKNSKLEFHQSEFPSYIILSSETDIGVRIEDSGNNWEIVGSFEQSHSSFAYAASAAEIMDAVSAAIAEEEEAFGLRVLPDRPIRIILFCDNSNSAIVVRRYQTEKEVEAFFDAIDLLDAAGSINIICSNAGFSLCSACNFIHDSLSTLTTLVRHVQHGNPGNLCAGEKSRFTAA